MLAVRVRKIREGLEGLLVVAGVERLHAVVVESFGDVALSLRLRSGLLRGGLETEDLLLMLILYLMYRESGDKELLIVLGAMLLL